MADFKNRILNFLDIETTGMNRNRDKIIEVYVSKVYNNEVIDSYHRMINPGFKPDTFILNLTHIDYAELEEAPYFDEIAYSFHKFINDGLFIAHNASFDYSFIKSHLSYFGYKIDPSYFCTVRLSRQLNPQHRRHNLDSIVERLNYQDGDRHRAEYDTEVIRHFFYKSLAEHGETKFQNAFSNSLIIDRSAYRTILSD